MVDDVGDLIRGQSVVKRIGNDTGFKTGNVGRYQQGIIAQQIGNSISSFDADREKHLREAI